MLKVAAHHLSFRWKNVLVLLELLEEVVTLGVDKDLQVSRWGLVGVQRPLDAFLLTSSGGRHF